MCSYGTVVDLIDEVPRTIGERMDNCGPLCYFMD
jgi:hypothetical protein